MTMCSLINISNKAHHIFEFSTNVALKGTEEQRKCAISIYTFFSFIVLVVSYCDIALLRLAYSKT